MHPVVPVRTYVVIWAILITLTFSTWAIAEFIDIGVYNIVIALAIACFKMSLVIWFFMHVKQDDGLTKIFVAAGFFFLLILLVITMADYNTRGWLTGGKFW